MAGMMNDPDIQAAMSNPKVRQTRQSDQLPSNKVLILRALSQGDGGAPGDDDQPGGDEAGGAGDEDFYKAKISTARFYFKRILPRIAGHKGAIEGGIDSLMELDAEHFAF